MAALRFMKETNGHLLSPMQGYRIFRSWVQEQGLRTISFSYYSYLRTLTLRKSGLAYEKRYFTTPDGTVATIDDKVNFGWDCLDGFGNMSLNDLNRRIGRKFGKGLGSYNLRNLVEEWKMSKSNGTELKAPQMPITPVTPAVPVVPYKAPPATNDLKETRAVLQLLPEAFAADGVVSVTLVYEAGKPIQVKNLSRFTTESFEF